MLASTTEHDLLTPALTAIVVGLGTLITQTMNHRKGKRADVQKNSAFERIEKAIDDGNRETRRTIEIMGLHLDEVERTANDAYTYCVGADGKNGFRSRLEAIDKRHDAEDEREREELDRLRLEREQQRRLGPNDVGSLTPRTV